MYPLTDDPKWLEDGEEKKKHQKLDAMKCGHRWCKPMCSLEQGLVAAGGSLLQWLQLMFFRKRAGSLCWEEKTENVLEKSVSNALQSQANS